MASLLSGNVSNQLVGVFLDSLLSRPYLAGFRVLGSRGGVGNLIAVVITTFVILFQLKRSPSSLHIHLPHSRFGNPLIISLKHDLDLASNQISKRELTPINRIYIEQTFLSWIPMKRARRTLTRMRVQKDKRSHLQLLWSVYIIFLGLSLSTIFLSNMYILCV
jgi:hypothetical protein